MDIRTITQGSDDHQPSGQPLRQDPQVPSRCRIEFPEVKRLEIPESILFALLTLSMGEVFDGEIVDYFLAALIILINLCPWLHQPPNPPQSIRGYQKINSIVHIGAAVTRIVTDVISAEVAINVSPWILLGTTIFRGMNSLTSTMNNKRNHQNDELLANSESRACKFCYYAMDLFCDALQLFPTMRLIASKVDAEVDDSYDAKLFGAYAGIEVLRAATKTILLMRQPNCNQRARESALLVNAEGSQQDFDQDQESPRFVSRSQ